MLSLSGEEEALLLHVECLLAPILNPLFIMFLNCLRCIVLFFNRYPRVDHGRSLALFWFKLQRRGAKIDMLWSHSLKCNFLMLNLDLFFRLQGHVAHDRFRLHFEILLCTCLFHLGCWLFLLDDFDFIFLLLTGSVPLRIRISPLISRRIVNGWPIYRMDRWNLDLWWLRLLLRWLLLYLNFLLNNGFLLLILLTLWLNLNQKCLTLCTCLFPLLPLSLNHGLLLRLHGFHQAPSLFHLLVLHVLDGVI